MNGRQYATDPTREQSPIDLSDEEETQDEHVGDYSTRFEELMSDGEESSQKDKEDEDEDEEGFFYSGVDAEQVTGYREQLRDVLGPEHEEDELEEAEVEHSLLHEVEENEKFAATIEDEALPVDGSSSPESPLSLSGFVFPPRISVSNTPPIPASIRLPFLNPAISRLRSVTPQSSRTPSAASHDYAEDISAAHSHFSALSRTTSASQLEDRQTSAEDREIFRWTTLRQIGDYLYGTQMPKASAVLGSPLVGSPTVIAANGLICVGTDSGKILVFDFKQNLKCVCGEGGASDSVGPVTALALSFDHTYVASGHLNGHIQLFDLRNPKTPARYVEPTTLAVIASGRQEGHLVGSRIVSVGFVAGRHTAIVSADDHGLAFFHSLGKVLFVDASDILRVLGKYPEEDPAIPHGFRRRRQRKPNAILAMSPLPLGPTRHPTDSYNLIALLTPIKLVIVGLKPTPKTWYRRHRPSDDDSISPHKVKGALAWYPSVEHGAPAESRPSKASKVAPVSTVSPPVLVYSWGNTLHLLRVSEAKFVQKTRNPRTGKVKDIEVGRIVFEEAGQWTASDTVLAVQWLNVNQTLISTPSALEVHDIRTFKVVEHVSFDAWSLVSPILSHTTNGAVSYPDAVTEISHSIRTYKGKIFLLGQHDIKVGTLLTWADRILSFVEQGDFLSAINLTRSYYVGEAPGNRNGLPDDPAELKQVVGEKLRELMVASAHYAFSEDRFTDSTHITADGRGVDRTELFEGLVVTSALSCIALNEFDFLFEDLYGYYDNYGIHRMYLLQLEPFILDGKIHQVPPRITQRLIAMHSEDNRPDLVERVIWHIDPDCLDINQAITLCQRYQLYDALIYVFTRALKDYVSPIVELLGLIRKINQQRRVRSEASPNSQLTFSESSLEADILNAYKIYPYLANVLTGLTYPSEQPLPEDEARQAKNDVYTFLFLGRSTVGEGGKLILTSDEENGVEPTYPYARLLLRFDAESFLHTLDLAFEDPYLNDDPQVSRLVIVKILYEILSPPGLSATDATFVNIFIARNAPKYPQFILIHMSPSVLQAILIGLAEVSDEDTREDRQLAAECLLSAYTPHDSAHIQQLFEQAGFYRILRSSYRQEHQWVPLLGAYLGDPNLPPADIFPSIEEVFNTATRYNKGVQPPEMLSSLTDSLPTLLHVSVTRTAAFIDQHIPSLHEKTYASLRERSARERYIYLRFLLGSPQRAEEDEYSEIFRQNGPSTHVPIALREEYVSLLCEVEPSAVIHELKYLPADMVNWSHVLATCEEHKVYDAVIWSLDYRGDPVASIAKAASFNKDLAKTITDALVSPHTDAEHSISEAIFAMKLVGTTAISICAAHSHKHSPLSSVDNLWFELLKSQISSVHRLSILNSDSNSSVPTTEALIALRNLVQETFTSLVSFSSNKIISFPTLFKRLVDSTAEGHAKHGAIYNEFRSILTGMLESYRGEGDMLTITKHLVDRDLFDNLEVLARERVRGWRPIQERCSRCKAWLKDSDISDSTPGHKVFVSRTGEVYHESCIPSEILGNLRTGNNVH
ncbi:VPS8 family protein [Abortiporus biennis]